MSDKNSWTLEKTQELYEFLQGKMKNKQTKFEKNAPKLTPEEAFSVIYYLQEGMRIIPDIYEKCSECHNIYNSDSEGHHNLKSFKFFCGNCEDLDDINDSDEW